MFYSPLRYPGGKNRLSEFIAEVCLENGMNGHFVEPFSGGASVALSLLIEGKAFAKGCVSLNPSVLELYRDLARFLH